MSISYANEVFRIIVLIDTQYFFILSRDFPHYDIQDVNTRKPRKPSYEGTTVQCCSSARFLVNSAWSPLVTCSLAPQGPSFPLFLVPSSLSRGRVKASLPTPALSKLHL